MVRLRVGSSLRTLRCAVPPSLGLNRAADVGGRFKDLLSAALAPDYQVEIVAAASYPELATMLVSGGAEIAWAPPFVCARVESGGGRALVRAVRGGSSTYRSALLCREGESLEARTMENLVGAWVDRDSTSGYLLPQAWLRRLGVDLARAFRVERFVGSFEDAAREVASGMADVTATYAAAATATRQYLGPDSLSAEMRAKLKVFAFTDEVPNDAIVASPLLPHTTTVVLRRKLASMAKNDANRPTLRQVFDAESLEEAPEKGYSALYGLALSTLTAANGSG
jgi:phosphonate transport system substrate-binding protein